jgi:hypothetical protein
MRHFSPRLSCAAVVLALVAATVQARQANNEPAACPFPALLKFIQKELAGKEGVRPADGVRVDSIDYEGGKLRLGGKVSTAGQREAVREQLAAARARLAKAVAVRISSIDVSGLIVEERGNKPGESNDSAGQGNGRLLDPPFFPGTEVQQLRLVWWPWFPASPFGPPAGYPVPYPGATGWYQLPPSPHGIPVR